MTTQTEGVKAGHTKGPWVARRMHTGGYDILDPRERDVVTVYGGGVETESRAANARLIAAAPDLLEALLAVQKTTSLGPVMEARVKAAISKAQGPSNG